MQTQTHLFEGIEIPEPPQPKPKSKYKEWKQENNYRKSESPMVRCDFCDHCMYIPQRSGRRYYKCELLGYSHCSATDIRLSCVCDLFKEAGKQEGKENV